MRTSHLEAACAVLGYDPGPVAPMTRGALRWRITLPPDSQPAGDGLLPTLIQWDIDIASQHPARVLADRGVRLRRLAVQGPPYLLTLLAGIDRDPRLALREAAAPALSAVFDTPSGSVNLD